jgi:aldehyde dehydrogenase (NAD+)
VSRLNPEEPLFIDGVLVDAEGGQTYEVVNPATEEVAGRVAAASFADADRALTAARRCFDHSDWPTNKTRRLRALTQLRNGLKAVAEDWRPQIVAESGCPISLRMVPCSTAR